MPALGCLATMTEVSDAPMLCLVVCFLLSSALIADAHVLCAAVCADVWPEGARADCAEGSCFAAEWPCCKLALWR